MLGFDLHWWETAMVTSLWLAAFAAVAVGVATYAVVQLQRAEVRAANLKVAQAAEAAAKATEHAAEASLALEKFKAPRQLSDEQVARIAEKLKSFQVGFDVAILDSDPEVDMIARQIIAALVAAGWKQSDWKIKEGIHFHSSGRFGKDTPLIGIVHAIGVDLQAHEESVATLGPPTNALVAALESESIKASTHLLTVENANPKLLHVLIGRKPH
jgi:hypothetical protein